MGHSSTRVTQDIYIHVRDDMFGRFFQATGQRERTSPLASRPAWSFGAGGEAVLIDTDPIAGDERKKFRHPGRSPCPLKDRLAPMRK